MEQPFRAGAAWSRRSGPARAGSAGRAAAGRREHTPVPRRYTSHRINDYEYAPAWSRVEGRVARACAHVVDESRVEPRVAARVEPEWDSEPASPGRLDPERLHGAPHPNCHGTCTGSYVACRRGDDVPNHGGHTSSTAQLYLHRDCRYERCTTRPAAARATGRAPGTRPCHSATTTE